MDSERHDRVVAHVAATRFPFAGQTTWPADYVTLTNAPNRQRGVKFGATEHFPDIIIFDGQGQTREIGEVEMTVSAASAAYLRASSDATDNLTPTEVKHFFVYVPVGLEAAAQELLESNAISYAGVRGFAVAPDGTISIVPFITKGDEYDHQ